MLNFQIASLWSKAVFHMALDHFDDAMDTDGFARHELTKEYMAIRFALQFKSQTTLAGIVTAVRALAVANSDWFYKVVEESFKLTDQANDTNWDSTSTGDRQAIRDASADIIEAWEIPDPRGGDGGNGGTGGTGGAGAAGGDGGPGGDGGDGGGGGAITLDLGDLVDQLHDMFADFLTDRIGPPVTVGEDEVPANLAERTGYHVILGTQTSEYAED